MVLNPARGEVEPPGIVVFCQPSRGCFEVEGLARVHIILAQALLCQCTISPHWSQGVLLQLLFGPSRTALGYSLSSFTRVIYLDRLYPLFALVPR